MLYLILSFLQPSRHCRDRDFPVDEQEHDLSADAAYHARSALGGDGELVTASAADAGMLLS
jgi:hypothetical protein